MKIFSSLLAQFVKDIAEGQYGEKLKAVYWALAGKKTLVALAFVAIYGFCQVAIGVMGQCAPECATPEAIQTFENAIRWIPEIAAFLVAVGLFDAAVRLDPPKK